MKNDELVEQLKYLGNTFYEVSEELKEIMEEFPDSIKYEIDEGLVIQSLDNISGGAHEAYDEFHITSIGDMMELVSNYKK